MIVVVSCDVCRDSRVKFRYVLPSNIIEAIQHRGVSEPPPPSHFLRSFQIYLNSSSVQCDMNIERCSGCCTFPCSSQIWRVKSEMDMDMYSMQRCLHQQGWVTQCTFPCPFHILYARCGVQCEMNTGMCAYWVSLTVQHKYGQFYTSVPVGTVRKCDIFPVILAWNAGEIK